GVATHDLRIGVGIGLDPELSAVDRKLSDDYLTRVVLEPFQLDGTKRGEVVGKGPGRVLHREPRSNARHRVVSFPRADRTVPQCEKRSESASSSALAISSELRPLVVCGTRYGEPMPLYSFEGKTPVVHPEA